MRNIILGKREFVLDPIKENGILLLNSNRDKMAVGNPDKNNLSEVGDLLYFICLRITGDEKEAKKLGEELIEQWSDSININQMQDAITAIRQELEQL